jgi:hypothetical protein
MRLGGNDRFRLGETNAVTYLSTAGREPRKRYGRNQIAATLTW